MTSRLVAGRSKGIRIYIGPRPIFMIPICMKRSLRPRPLAAQPEAGHRELLSRLAATHLALRGSVQNRMFKLLVTLLVDSADLTGGS